MHIRTQSGNFIVFTPNSNLYIDHIKKVRYIYPSVHVEEFSGEFVVTLKTDSKIEYISGITNSHEVAQKLVDQIMDAYFNNLKVFKPDYSEFSVNNSD